MRTYSIYGATTKQAHVYGMRIDAAHDIDSTKVAGTAHAINPPSDGFEFACDLLCSHPSMRHVTVCNQTPYRNSAETQTCSVVHVVRVRSEI